MPDPHIIAVVSGKGGVGKTMLAVAVANELARNTRTLIIDLDFFNRGLTGLMGPIRTAREICSVPKPDFLFDAGEPGVSEDRDPWKIMEVDENLLHIAYDDLTEAEIRKFETMDTAHLRESLGAFVNRAAAACDCQAVVLDCHGGPDNSSFAACLVADHSLLVSEPDRITLFGTLNFLRQIQAAAGDVRADIRLVFNKVVPAFTTAFLHRFYDHYLKDEFDGKPLLAIYPMEVHLTKEFERTPFLSKVFPTSLLARKTKILLFDLFEGQTNRLPRLVARAGARWLRTYFRKSLGRPFFLFDLDFVMPAIVTGVILVAAIVGASEIFFVDDLREARRAKYKLTYVVALSEETKAGNPRFVDAAEQTQYLQFLERRADGRRDTLRDSRLRSKYIKLANSMARGALKERVVYLRPSNVSTIVRIFKSYDVAPAYRARYAALVGQLEFSRWYSSLVMALTDQISKNAEFLAGFAALWFVCALVIRWHGLLDVRMTYHFRRGALVPAMFTLLVMVCLWFFPAMLTGLFIRQALRGRDLEISAPAAVFSLSVFTVIAVNWIYRSVNSIRIDRSTIEAVSRIIFIVYIISDITITYVVGVF